MRDDDPARMLASDGITMTPRRYYAVGVARYFEVHPEDPQPRSVQNRRCCAPEPHRLPD